MAINGFGGDGKFFYSSLSQQLKNQRLNNRLIKPIIAQPTRTTITATKINSQNDNGPILFFIKIGVAFD